MPGTRVPLPQPLARPSEPGGKEVSQTRLTLTRVRGVPHGRPGGDISCQVRQPPCCPCWARPGTSLTLSLFICSAAFVIAPPKSCSASAWHTSSSFTTKLP